MLEIILKSKGIMIKRILIPSIVNHNRYKDRNKESRTLIKQKKTPPITNNNSNIEAVELKRSLFIIVNFN